MKVVVTGGAGYIGSVAVERLIERGDEVTVFDSLWRGHREAVDKSAAFMQVDVRDADAVEAALLDVRPEAVLHFAAATLVPESVEQPAEYFTTNVVGSQNILAGMIRAGVRKFVFSSTAAVYGEPETETILETAPLRPINPYGVSKLITEQLLPSYERAYGLSYVVFRYFNVAGATKLHGEDHRPETHVIPVALQTLLGQRATFRLFGTDYPTSDGTAVRDYVHVVDLADAHLLALDRLDRTLGAFNLGSKDGFSVRQLVDAVERVTGLPLPVGEAPRRAGDPPVLIADSTRARTELGWRPNRSTLEEMIGSAWDWMQRNPSGYSDGREVSLD
ncbi:MAG: UDP-glucose 4-epimerase GalE [Thermomicrobiales bacterium]|nr:UDP-glucose 4-epimerase GalE [Thermomicrobiales bacterium]